MEQQKEEISTLGSVATLVYKALLKYQVDPVLLFHQAGIEVTELGKPETRFPTTKMQKLWNLSVQATGDESFGLVAADQLQPAVLHGLGFAWLASETLHDALKRLIRYSRLINSHANAYLEENRDTVNLVVAKPANWQGEIEPATADVAMAVFLRMCRLTAVEEIHPDSVYLHRPIPNNTKPYEHYFQAPIHYASDVNKLCFNRQLVDTTLPTSNPELARINDETVIQYLARFDKASIIMKVRAQIIENLPDGSPDQAKIADSLHLSLRSMQRKLKDKNTSYRELLEDTRKDLALQYIKECHHSISEITYMLGFSEPSNFTRAFKRWTGSSPIDYRNAHTQ